MFKIDFPIRQYFVTFARTGFVPPWFLSARGKSLWEKAYNLAHQGELLFHAAVAVGAPHVPRLDPNRPFIASMR